MKAFKNFLSTSKNTSKETLSQILDEMKAIKKTMATKDEVTSIRNEMATKQEVASIKQDVSTIKASMATQKELDKLSVSQRENFKYLRIEVLALQKSLGATLEQMAAGLVEAVLRATGMYDSPVLINHKIYDKEGIVHGQPQPVELDVFVERPSLVVESKDQISPKNFDRVEVFAKKVQFIRAIYGPFIAFLLVTSVDANLLPSVKAICEANDIYLVKGHFTYQDLAEIVERVYKQDKENNKG